jgi:hypothetical protein
MLPKSWRLCDRDWNVEGMSHGKLLIALSTQGNRYGQKHSERICADDCQEHGRI